MKYKVKEFKPWKDRDDPSHKTLAKDKEGNILGSLVIEGDRVEPVDARFKVIPKVGDTIVGEIITSQKGRETFMAQEPDWKQATIQAQWALGQALMYAPDHEDLDKIKVMAESYIHTVNQIVNEER